MSTTVSVSILPTGRLYLPDRWIFAGADLHIKRLYPDYSFHVQHPSGRSLMFDLGIRKDIQSYPPAAKGDFHLNQPESPKSAAELLLDAGIESSSIDFVIYSHLHWDHVGDISEFPKAQVILGPGATEYASPGYPAISDSPFLGSVFEHPGGVRELSRTSDNWASFPPFAHALDFFADGSLLLLDAPGHMPGHIMALARTAQDEYILMGGDCCHHRSLFTGEAVVGVGFGPTGLPSMHLDLETANKTIQQVGQLEERDDTLVCLAHDWFLEPALELFPATVNGWRSKGVKSKIRAAKGEKLENTRECLPPL